MLEKYAAYLNMISEKIEKFFKKQQPYIFCKKGCSKCCENAQYPFSEIEYKYLMSGYHTLPYTKQEQIHKNILNVLNEKHNTKEKPFTYKCPFLINNECSVYKYRGIICRTFGLLVADNGGSDVPFCALDGLNYSNVYDSKKHLISSAMFNELGIKEEPLAFNIQYNFLTSAEFANGYGFEFGKTKPLIDWFENNEDFKHIKTKQ